MEILQEVTHSMQLIDELLFNNFGVNKDETAKLEKKLDDDEFQHLKHLISVYKRLHNDDEYSLSEKGLATFRNSTQRLLHHLRTIEENKQELQLRLKGTAEASRILNYKSFLINHKSQLSFLETSALIAMLIVGLFVSLITTLAIFVTTDENYLIIFSEIIFLLFLYSLTFHNDSELNTELRFRFGHSAHLLWKVLLISTPLTILAFIIGKYKHFWLDDMLIIVHFSLSILIIYKFSKATDWLKETLEIDKKETESVQSTQEPKAES